MEYVNQNPPVKKWTLFEPSLCNGCWAGCCHGMPVQVSVPDLIRMGYLSEEQAACDPFGAISELQQDGVLQQDQPEALVWMLKQTDTGDCIFLDEKRNCSIYDVRPEICRQFPSIGPKPGYCPHTPLDALEED